MSLLPLDAMHGMLFVEARLLGNPGTVISQIGLSVDSPNASVAVFSRASGVLLVAGVGSYCAYRLCSNLLGNRFVWEFIEASRFDRIPSADRRLLLSHLGGTDEAVGDSEEDGVDRVSVGARSLRSPSQVSLARLSRVRRSTRGAGLNAIARNTRRLGVISRQSSNSRLSTSSVPYSGASNKSASLRILWEGSQGWDDEFGGQDETPSVICRLGAVPSTSYRRDDCTSVGDLCSVFNDVMSVTSAVEIHDPLLDDLPNETDHNVADEAWLKRMTSSKYMYESVVVQSECGSSNASPQHSFHSKLELDDEPTTSSDGYKHMTQSSNSRPSNGRSMYDSAIGAEISSDDGSFFDASKRQNPIREVDSCSVAPSCMSLEWCDEGLREGMSTALQEEVVDPLRRANLDWDFESEAGFDSDHQAPFDVNVAFAPKESRDLMVLACEIFQPYSPPFKEIQHLYHRRRLKRFAIVRQNDALSTLQALIRSLLYHRCSLQRDLNWETLEKRFDATLEECDFLARWPSRGGPKLKLNLQKFWQLASKATGDVTEDDVNGLQVLLVIEAKRVYDEGLAGLYCDWFTLDDPSQLMRLFVNNQPVPHHLLWNLVCRVCAVSVELYDVQQMSAKATVARFASASPSTSTSLTWLQYNNLPMPLFYVPDDQ